MPNWPNVSISVCLDFLQLRRIGRDTAFAVVLLEQIDSGQLIVFGIPFLRRC